MLLRPRRLGLPVLLALALPLTACGGGSPATEPAAAGGNASGGGTLGVGLAFVPRGGLAVETDDAFLLGKLGVAETLVRAGADGVAKPGLATAWQRVDDRSWRFELREGVRFHDGSALDAAAVVRALTHVAGVTSPPRALAGTGLTAQVDGAAVVVGTKEPDPVLPLRLSSPSTAVLAAAAYEASPVTPVGTGTGPFEITDVDLATGLTLVRNDDYWDGEVRLEGADVRFLSEAPARVAALRAGDVDVIENAPPTSAAELEGDSDLELLRYAAPRTTSLYLNTASGPLADPRVRRALALAVDRPLLVETVLEGEGEPAVGVFGPAVAWGERQAPPAADPAAARDLLRQAGYADEPLTLRLATYSARPELPELATALQGMLEEAGVRTMIRVAEYSALEPEVLGGDFDLFLLSRSYLTDFPDAGGFLASDFTCKGSYNLNRYCSPELDALISRLPQVTDAAQRQEVFRQAAAVLREQTVGVPLLHTGSLTAARTRVGGLVVDPLERLLLTPAVHLR